MEPLACGAVDSTSSSASCNLKKKSNIHKKKIWNSNLWYLETSIKIVAEAIWP